MTITSIALANLDGTPESLAPLAGKAILLVNVASKCGLTPQYEGLEQLQKTYGSRGFSVIGVPCNQFLGQEPGTPEEIATFCSATYGVTFPLTEKIEVNGENRHELFDVLCAVNDGEGEAGDVQWNFEKWLIHPDGTTVQRFRPGVVPEDAGLVAAIEAVLPA
jgi:glutathione peroxidase